MGALEVNPKRMRWVGEAAVKQCVSCEEVAELVVGLRSRGARELDQRDARERGRGDEAFQRTDGNRLQLDPEQAGFLAEQLVLTDASTDPREGVGLLRIVRRYFW